MAESFFVTNKGVELITQAIANETKVDIKKVQFGSGGDSASEPNYDIQSLGHMEYSKDLDPITDTYEILDTVPKSLYLKTIVPAEVECTINEIGYFDTQENLIIYGIVRELKKERGLKHEYDNYVKFENIDTAGVEIVIISPEYEKVEQLVETTKEEFDQKLSEASSSLTKILEQAESDFDLSNYVSHDEYQTLLDMVDSSNAIMEEYVG